MAAMYRHFVVTVIAFLSLKKQTRLLVDEWLFYFLAIKGKNETNNQYGRVHERKTRRRERWRRVRSKHSIDHWEQPLSM